MRKRLDITGERYGKLVVLGRVEHLTKRNPWLVKCDCGNTHISSMAALRGGSTKSCGCLKTEENKSRTKHGHRKGGKETPTWSSYRAMKRRCYQETNKDWDRYGGRGIKVCDRWLNSFENFLEDMGERPSKEFSLERIDFNGDYAPENCLWADNYSQSRNKSTNVWVEYEGKMMILKDFARLVDVDYVRLSERASRLGISPLDAYKQIDKNFSE